jgi:hypothetical protein
LARSASRRNATYSVAYRFASAAAARALGRRAVTATTSELPSGSISTLSRTAAAVSPSVPPVATRRATASSETSRTSVAALRWGSSDGVKKVPGKSRSSIAGSLNRSDAVASYWRGRVLEKA